MAMMIGEQRVLNDLGNVRAEETPHPSLRDTFSHGEKECSVAECLVKNEGAFDSSILPSPQGRGAGGEGRLPATTQWPTYTNEQLILTLDETADPALEPTLALSQQYAEAGASVTVTATVKNVGRAETGVLTVTLYSGTVATGTVQGQQVINDALALSDSRDVVFMLAAAGGEELISAEITTPLTETTTANNSATATLINLPAPAQVSANATDVLTDGVQISWDAPADVSNVDRYRILRSTTSGSGYMLIGETRETTFADDLTITPQTRAANRSADTALYYVIQTVDSNGTRSAFSAEAVYMPPNDVTLELVPSQTEIDISERLTVAIRVNAGSETVDSVAAHLQFDPAVLRVESIAAGTPLPNVVTSQFNNISGTIDFVADGGTPTGTFDVAIVEFSLLQVADSAEITFRFTSDADSDARRSSLSVLDGASGTAVAVGAVPTSVVVLRGISADIAPLRLLLILWGGLVVATIWSVSVLPRDQDRRGAAVRKTD